MFNLFLAVSPEIFIINATFILLIHGVVFSTSKKYDYPPLVSNVGWLGLLSVTIYNIFWNNLFRRDNFTYFCQILLLLSTAGTISMCFDSSEQERFDAFEFIVLIPLPTRSMLFMISAYDSIAMYLAIEPQSLCFYVIAASKRKSEFSTEAGSKYLILGAFSSGILLFGCSMIYGSTGATHFDQLAKILTGYEITGARSSGIFMGILFIAVGFLFKITAVPYMWAPDIYEGSPTPVTAFLSIAPKISISANISRLSIYGSYGATLQQIFFFCSIASMILGALAAMAQTKVKRFYYIRLAKRMFFDTPRTWILYEPMDRDKSLLLAMTSSFITSFFPYPSPLFSVTHQMALSSYL
ncbi:NADH dehydrogenase subunit 2 (mitochondrion) [Salvia miltiorrhiza]|uniref:NADH dehydrogenase subunit 2 n=1 Tax=Salvia miltiorrhiza TaxID=226208 RepID=V9P4U4_SALMI|nr:NADH dehydrogenase subunit 2 [Salvia miltiorrhiza]AGU16670.1 NADH dehydrogenase subunit 2 [Salvia miltiorrhiza]